MRVELQGVQKSYLLPGGGLVTALKGIDLVMESGALYCITGPAGSGKTTLLNVMGGLARQTSGSVTLDGRMFQGYGARRPGGISWACQEPVFIPELTVMENLLLPAFRVSDCGTLERAERLIEELGLAELFDLYPFALSGGEKQRLNLARALILPPRLLLLDEPTAYLDEGWRGTAMGVVMKEVHANRATLVIGCQCAVTEGGVFRLVRMQSGKVIEDDNCDY